MCAYYAEYDFPNFWDRDISEMVIRTKKSIRTFFVENFMINNFYITYFCNNTYRLRKKCKKPIFLTLDLE